MEWCGEIYREMDVEEFIRRGVSVMLAMLLLLAMVTGGDPATEEKELPSISVSDAGTLPSGVGLFPDVFSLIEGDGNLAFPDDARKMPVLPVDEPGAGTVLMADSAVSSDAVPADMEMTEVLLVEEIVAEGAETDGAGIDIPAVVFPKEEVPDNEIPAADIPGTDVPVMDIPSSGGDGADVPSSDIPAADIPQEDIPAADIPETGVSDPDSPGAGDALTDDSGSDIPDSDIPGTGDAVSDPPASDIPEDSASAGDVSDGTAEAPAEDPANGFIIDESGMICGISDAGLAVTDLCLNLPAEGCTGIARGAFAGVAAEIVEVHIPSGITYIEEGAFAGMSQVCKFEVEAGNSVYYTENGVLFSEGGSCILAFPAGRTGTYSVPAQVTRFASDAFEGSMLSKIDTRACALEDPGNLPESISIL
ncbi:MAG TPA: hypothetical protein H9711_09410 [Candidatus Mediterraneibacter intestinavium]|nr:hypothetical protein [Candidatus Mediterraneibacter intestinavium]